jgi:hypothetical protein
VDLDDGGALWDHVRHPDYTLLTMPSGKAADTRAEQLQVRFGSVSRLARLPRSTALSVAYGFGDGRLYLIRPVGYVAGVVMGWLSGVRTLVQAVARVLSLSGGGVERR